MSKSVQRPPAPAALLCMCVVVAACGDAPVVVFGIPDAAMVGDVDGSGGDTADGSDGAHDPGGDADAPLETGSDAVQDAGETSDPGDTAEDEDADGACDRNACGGCAVLSHAPGEACGPCELDAFVCDGNDAVVCDGATTCGLVVATDEVVDVMAWSATVRGRVVSVGAPVPTGHGFCWGSESEPRRGQPGVSCQDFGAVDEPYAMEWTLLDLDAGADVHVRAFAFGAAGSAYGADIGFTTVPPAPGDVQASDGETAGGVFVRWTAAPGATGYALLRDGESVVEVDGESVDAEGEWLDADAPAGGLPTADALELAATDATLTDRVRVTWSAVATAPGAPATYAVVAFNDSGSSEVSEADEGFRAAESIVGYEVRVGDGAWTSVGDALAWDDTDAPPGTVAAGTVAASDGTVFEGVSVELTGTETAPGGAREYSVRAVFDTGGASAEALATGRRGVGTPTVVWQRSEADADARYGPLDVVVGLSGTDTGAPLDGGGRYYRAVVAAAGAADATSSADRGYRRTVAPLVETDSPADIGATGAWLRGTVTALGAPLATAHGFCWGLEASPALGVSNCTNLGAPAAPGTFGFRVEGLAAGSVVHFRAWATNLVGTTYGADVAFTTVPPPPAFVAASDGAYPGFVRITWSASPGAIGYRVLRSGEVVHDAPADARSYDDTGAIPGEPPDGWALAPTATTDRTDTVVVAWTAAGSTGPGESAQFSVVAVGEWGDSDASLPDNGYRGVEPVVGYEVRVGDGPWSAVGSVLSWSHGAAPAGTIDPGAADAEDGIAEDAVRVSLVGAGTEPGDAVAYSVRAVSGSATGAGSPQVVGRRAVGGVTVRWQRSAADSDTGFADVPDATGPVWFDVDGVARPDGRYYRAIVTADGAESAVSASDRGFLGLGVTIEQVVLGSWFGCVRLSTGDVRCWGSNHDGACGNGLPGNVGDETGELPPPDVPLPGPASWIAAGDDFACAIVEPDGAVHCWGDGAAWRLGTGDTTSWGTESNPGVAPAVDLPAPAVRLASGWMHTCALLEGGDVYCWGGNGYWQADPGDSSPTAGQVPTRIALAGPAVDVAVGSYASCAALQSGVIVCWGDWFGDRLALHAVDVGGQAMTVRGGGTTFCAGLDGGTFRCFGSNGVGTAGVGSSDGSIGDDPEDLPPAETIVADGTQSIGLRGGTACGPTATGTVHCWGSNASGKLGIGSTTPLGTSVGELPPAPIDVGGSVTAVGVGDNAVCAVLGFRDLACWGHQGNGVLGAATEAIGDDPGEMPPAVLPVR